MRLVLCVRISWRTFWVVVMVWAMIVNVAGNDPGNHLSKDTKEAAYWYHNSCLFLIYCIIYCIMWWKVGTVGGLSPPKTATSQYTTHSWEGPIASDQWPVHCLANEKLTQEVSTKQEDLEENMGAVTERGRQRCIFLDLTVRKVVALETKHLFHEYQTLKTPFFFGRYTGFCKQHLVTTELGCATLHTGQEDLSHEDTKGQCCEGIPTRIPLQDATIVEA